MTDKRLPDGCDFIVGDAVEKLREFEGEAAAIFLDDAWARPKRAEHFGVEYDTHPFEEGQTDIGSHVDRSLTTKDLIDAAYDALMDGGWLIADADDWLLPRLTNYVREEWGDVAESYRGGGFRKIGGVTYLKSDDTPDKSTSGMYLSTGGYPVMFAHKGETDRRTAESARQIAYREREKYGWGSVKPVLPYENWVKGLVDEDELILVPCAGTAPAAIAAEKVHGEAARYVCIDNQEDARESFLKRRESELQDLEQKEL